MRRINGYVSKAEREALVFQAWLRDAINSEDGLGAMDMIIGTLIALFLFGMVFLIFKYVINSAGTTIKTTVSGIKPNFG